MFLGLALLGSTGKTSVVIIYAAYQCSRQEEVPGIIPGKILHIVYKNICCYSSTETVPMSNNNIYFEFV